MAHYEFIVLAKASLTDEQAGTLLEKIKSDIKKLGGRVLHAANWGRKKLAYEISKEKKGIYLIVRLEAPVSVGKELEKSCRLDEQIMRSMIVSVGAEEGLPPAESQSAEATQVGAATTSGSHD